MGDKYQCMDCKEYFKEYECRSCHEKIKDRCYWCHFDYMIDKYGLFGFFDKKKVSENIHV